jgi:hypothetical protein
MGKLLTLRAAAFYHLYIYKAAAAVYRYCLKSDKLPASRLGGR